MNRLALILIAAFSLSGCGVYVVDSGNVGVEKTLGKVSMTETGEGLNFKLPLLTSVVEYSAKEIPVDFEDLKPKAGDNLTLQDLDVSVFYQAIPSSIAELSIKYAGVSSVGEDGFFLPAFSLVMREARSAIYNEVGQVDSLVMHQRREELADNIMNSLQSRLDSSDPGVFAVTRVVVRALNTDPSIEDAIRLAVQAEKTLEAKHVQVEIAEQDALIKVAEARGIADANNIINSSLTGEYLQHEINMALQSFAENGSNVIVIPANMQGLDLILGSDTINRAN